MIEDEADHGLFFHAQVLFDLLGDPWPHDPVHNRVGFEGLVIDDALVDVLLLLLQQRHVDLFALREDLLVQLLLDLIAFFSLLVRHLLLALGLAIVTILA